MPHPEPWTLRGSPHSSSDHIPFHMINPQAKNLPTLLCPSEYQGPEIYVQIVSSQLLEPSGAFQKPFAVRAVSLAGGNLSSLSSGQGAAVCRGVERELGCLQRGPDLGSTGPDLRGGIGLSRRLTLPLHHHISVGNAAPAI